MNHQTFFLSPKFNKKPIYSLPSNKYQEFTNAYVYSIMVKTGNGDPNRAELCDAASKEWNKIKKEIKQNLMISLEVTWPRHIIYMMYKP